MTFDGCARQGALPVFHACAERQVSAVAGVTSVVHVAVWLEFETSFRGF